MTAWTIQRQVAFFPTTHQNGGKIHASWKVAGTAVCGANVDLATQHTPWVTVAVGDDSDRVHPMVCRRCLALTTKTAGAAQGVRQ